MLTREGATGHEFIIVLDGEVEVRKGNNVIATRGPGTYVGEIALLDHRPRTATVVATTPVRIEVIGQREFAGLMSEVPEISQAAPRHGEATRRPGGRRHHLVAPPPGSPFKR